MYYDCICVCLYVYICVNVGKIMPGHACRSHRTIFGQGPSLSILCKAKSLRSCQLLCRDLPWLVRFFHRPYLLEGKSSLPVIINIFSNGAANTWYVEIFPTVVIDFYITSPLTRYTSFNSVTIYFSNWDSKTMVIELLEKCDSNFCFSF